jgi:hypothetical protein
LKRCIVKAEKFIDPDGSRTVLYLEPEAQMSLQPTEKVAILDPEISHGAAPETAFALVFLGDLTTVENDEIGKIDLSARRENDPKYCASPRTILPLRLIYMSFSVLSLVHSD